MHYDEKDMAYIKSFETPESREELEEKISELETEIMRLDSIVAGQAYDQSELYGEKVRLGEPVCLACTNALYTATKAGESLTFSSCLLSGDDSETYQCNQFKPSPSPLSRIKK